MDQNDPQIYCTWEWNALISSKRPTIWYKTSADVSLYSSCCQNGHEVDKLFFIIFLTTFINFKICSKNIFFQWFLLSNKMMKDIWHTGTILRAYGVISSDFVPFLLHIWKVNKIENGDIFHFFLPRNDPNGQTLRGWKKFLIICYYFDQVSHSDFKKDIFSAKI